MITDPGILNVHYELDTNTFLIAAGIAYLSNAINMQILIYIQSYCGNPCYHLVHNASKIQMAYQAVLHTLYMLIALSLIFF